MPSRPKAVSSPQPQPDSNLRSPSPSPSSLRDAAPELTTQDALNSSIKGAGYLFLLQLSSRMATFLLNNFIHRVSSIRTVGIASDLELLSGTILFLSRENLRMALLRNVTDDVSADTVPEKERAEQREKHNRTQRQKLVNLSFLPLLAGLLLVFFMATFKREYLDRSSAWMYVIAALLELCSEPMYLLVQSGLMYRARARVEGTALLVRCLVTFALTLASCASKSGDEADACGVRSYAWGHVAYSVMLVLGYLWELSRDRGGLNAVLRVLRPRQIDGDASRSPYYFDRFLLSVAWSFTAQSGLKYALTEGDRLVLLWMGRGNDEKGAYKMVSDLGSLIARIVFQPIEEAARAFFSRTLTGGKALRVRDVALSIDLLSTLLRFHLLLGAYFVFLAPNYSGTLIALLYGPAKASSPEIVLALAVYCFYVPLMGMNGIAEGFVQGVGDSAAIRRQSTWMIACSFVFVAVAYAAMNVGGMGPAGLVLANMANMAMRIRFCRAFIRKYLRAPPGMSAADAAECRGQFDLKMRLSALVPGDRRARGALLAACAATFWYARRYGWATWRAKGGHVALGVLCGVVVTGLMYIAERHRLFAKLREYNKMRTE
ncbi:Oligosaccharide translocation protein rft1 [Geranomyces variabilis]|uniref:Man(5)GlcNAc(2)-PP-dolichol translocation protein RFT1 n=1 Tax=Geranomyces variabilis TaxID=109894 RepID=A0AAD5XN53_9FUNG|nr:Oligosaccharide translocation protein rft1 [Geranomyces variabilis]